MFESLRKNIQTVQEGISAGLQRLSVGDRTPTTPTESDVNLGAGADLLQMYQTQWNTMHHIAEQNSILAQGVDKQITDLKDEFESQYSKMVEIHSLLAHLPNIMSQLHSLLATIGTVRGLFEEVEGGLLALEDLTDELESQEKTLDLRLSLALATEKHNYQLNEKKKELTLLHEIKMSEAQKKLDEKRKEKETMYAEQFNQDVKKFKESGTIEKPITDPQSSNLKLEDVELDQESSDLDKFLEDPAS